MRHGIVDRRAFLRFAAGAGAAAATIHGAGVARAAEPKRGGTLRLLQIEPAVGFNPALEGTNWPETQRMIYNGLTDYGPTGALAGYYRGWVDHVIMRVADALLIVPTFFLVLSIAFIFGGRLVFVIVLLGVTTWPQIARIVRAEVLALREEAFVVAACALGVGDAKLVFREILPNTLPPVIAMVALLASSGILTEASLSFLGVGDPNVVSLGQMLTSGLEYATSAWWVPAFPGAAIFVLVLLLNVLGDGLNVALNPRLRSHLG